MKWKRLTCFLLAMSASAALFGCKPSESELEQRAVEQFRTKLAAAQYHEIYLASSDMLRKKLTEVQLAEMLEATKLDLGSYQSANLRDRELTTYAKGLRLVRLTYGSAFSKRSGIEEGFAFEKTHRGLKLAGYWYKNAN
ncbi:hypothetical protein SOASR030_36850 [Leminorella grimontii]|uniref:Lipoprotein n=1 Tax=Leminorella grimontii TaxID=82981 RepID=A0AAV5N7Y5_9GAMM|nr:hypothetical protein [Leminorella grimontii]KFC94234.1 hypothetical protein GLGR_2799 [Leminorella grimontii ATCC 33999 = DSM 5078]GKX57573.1 hypothetical protein SOASR030_36850 [Leminorella grimontii]GKX60042.1 hypothetical protein SOASR031_23570 [Leminorella grimontii]